MHQPIDVGAGSTIGETPWLKRLAACSARSLASKVSEVGVGGSKVSVGTVGEAYRAKVSPTASPRVLRSALCLGG